MNILFTVSGRAGSKGVKNKNIRDFLGKPLVYYTLSAIDLFIKEYKEKENLQIHSCLNTDSPSLINLIRKQSMVDMMVQERSEELAGDRVPKVWVTRDSLYAAEKEYNKTFDYVIDVDITSPLRTYEDIYNAFCKSKSNSKIDLTYSVTESRRNPYFNMVCQKENGYHTVLDGSGITTRQQAPVTYDMNASIYVYKREYLVSDEKENKGYFEISIMQDTGILDIDSEEDFELMQIIAEHLFKKNKMLQRIRDNIC